MPETTPDKVSHVGGPSFSSSASSSTGATKTPDNAAPITNNLSKQRVRKRSFFGKVSKPAIPVEPLPILQQQHIGKQEETLSEKKIPQEKSFLNKESIQSSERSPVRNFVLRRNQYGHGRSPSTSALPSHSDSSTILVSQDLKSLEPSSSSSSRQQSLHLQEIKDQSFQHPGEGNSNENLSQSLGRKSGAMNAINQSPAWYNRGPMAKAHILSSSIVRGRDRSASVTSNRSNSKDQSNWEKDVNHIGAVPSSPSSIRRTFSKKSVHSSRGTEISSVDLSDKCQSRQGSENVEDTPNVKAKRRLFGRSSRANENVGSPVSSSAMSTGRQHHDKLSSGTTSTAQGFLRRVSSRSMLKSNSETAEVDPMASTDSLVSNSASSISRGMTRRAGEVISKTASFANWNRKNRSAISVHEETDESLHSNSDPMERQDTVPSTSEFGSMRDEVLIEQPSSSPSKDDANETGIPKRLSGWFFNILGTENEVTAESRKDVIPISDSTATLKQAPSTLSPSNENQIAGKTKGQPVSEVSNRTANTNASVLSTSTPRSRTAGLLSTLAASSRNRTEVNNAAISSNSSTGGALGSGVNVARSGLDRALRYFIDNSDHNSDTETGAWLLGVWHGPPEKPSTLSIDTSSNLRPAIEVSNATPERENLDHTSTNAERTTNSSKRDSEQGLEDNSSLASSAQRTGETSPSIHSASSSRGSTGKKKGPVDVEANEATSGDEIPVVAHNPPTPQASPIVSQVPSSPSSSATRKHLRRPLKGTESGSNLANLIQAGGDNQASFQSDFSSRIWCTYRSHFTPIARDGTISSQAENAAAVAAASSSSLATLKITGQDVGQSTHQKNSLGISPSSLSSDGTPSRPTQQLSTSPNSLGASFGISPSLSTSPSSSAQHHSNQSTGNSGGGGLGERMGIPNLWNRATAAAQAYGLAGRSGLTTDAGWGCMLRTGQSVLANALIDVHLGRSWRRTARPVPLLELQALSNNGPEESNAYHQWQNDRKNYVKYVQLLTWFMDEPSLACPFGVHRMAREGKRLGKEVGEWFGPSTAAGAIKKLVDEFPACGLGVNVASDGVIYLDQVKAQASTSSSSIGHKRNGSQSWDRPVLILIGIRLGLEGVHPMYHDSIKATFSFPQSVGIAGGRPSSSYYFVGHQGNSLFYLDPHHVRPSINFKHPPPFTQDEEEWWINVYTEQELASYHNDRPRRMPMKSLDPSMLLGFLLQNESDLIDFVERVKALPRPIFSVLESMPKWMMDDLAYDDEDAEEKAIESISESSADDFEIGTEDKLGAMHDAGNESQVDENANSTVTVGNESSSQVEMNGTDLVLIKEQTHSTKSKNINKQNQNRTSLVNIDGSADNLAQSSMTPQSETTFELVSPYTPAQRSSDDKQADLGKKVSAQPIAFPTFADDGEEEDLYEIKAGTGKSKANSITPPRLSLESLQEVSALSESGSTTNPIKSESLSPSQTLQPNKDKKREKTHSGVSASDIESAWEDLQDDTFSSPKIEGNNSWSHADAIVKRAEENDR